MGANGNDGRLLRLAMLATAVISGQAQASCERRFYNLSEASWLIKMHGGARCNGEAEVCIVPPFQNMSLTYSLGVNPLSPPRVELSSTVFKLHVYFLQWNNPFGCPFLRHVGSTGNIILNEPRDGDMVTCRGKCQAKAPQR